MTVKVWLMVVLMGWGSVAGAATLKAKDKTVKWQPRMRAIPSTPLPKANLSLAQLRPFLKSSLMLDHKKQFEKAPIIVALQSDHLEGGRGSTLYAQGISTTLEPTYVLLREGKTYYHPLTRERLGFEAEVLGEAALKRMGRPSELEITLAEQAVEVGDRMLPHFVVPLPEHLNLCLSPLLVEEGYILSIKEGLAQAGAGKVVVLSLGQREGVKEGHILEIYQSGKKVLDPSASGWRKKRVKLPDTKIGKLIVYQVHEKLSLALILEAKDNIQLLDKVKGFEGGPPVSLVGGVSTR